MLNEALRKLAIGGSEIGAILGVDPDRDALAVWASKRGNLTPIADRDAPTYMILGRMLEEGVLRIYEHITGRATEYCNDSRLDPTRPYMVWTPDGLCRSERRGVDAKIVRWDQGYKWGETADDIPPRIITQCWWYMAAADYDVWDVCALVGCQDVRIYQIDRDQEAEREMLFRAQEFYRRYLIGNERPPVTRRSDEVDRWLKQAFPRETKPVRAASDTEAFLLDEYSRIRIREDELNTLRETLETRLKLILEDAEGLAWPAGRITYRVTKSGGTDWKKLAEMLLSREVTVKERAALLEQYAKPGTRRLLWDCDASQLPPVLSAAGSAELLQDVARIAEGVVPPEPAQLIELEPAGVNTMGAPMKSVRELLAEMEAGQQFIEDVKERTT
jgi:predicted phage-related endonuclease